MSLLDVVVLALAVLIFAILAILLPEAAKAGLLW
jgi:hypothetical protein